MVKRKRGLTLSILSIFLILLFNTNSYALPVDGVVAAGTANISSTAGNMTINQTTPKAVINWQNFNIETGEAVQFAQPDSSSVALNRVQSADPSRILGSLSANGQVFLVNQNGILFGKDAQVNVGGLVASTQNITDSHFMAGNYKLSGANNGKVLNQGAINADGGYVALLGGSVSNEGIISAKLGTVALAAGEAMTLDMAGDGLLNVTVNQGAVNALVENGGMIKADGGQVLMTTQAAGNLLQSVVNNTGVVQAQTIESHNGTIKLLGDMQSGTMKVSGTLDASAPNGKNGGFIETSAAHVNVANNAIVTTQAPQGKTGTWLIDPQDFNIGSTATDNISGATLSALLVTNSVSISTNTGPDATIAGTPPVTSLNTATVGNGDINVNDAISWTATPSTTTLTLTALRDVNINRAITAVNGNLAVCCGRDANVNAAVTTTRGSVLLAAGSNVNVNAPMTTTDGNITLCAGNNVNISSAMTLTRGSTIPSQSLGLAPGMVLSSGNSGTGPGVAGGTVIFAQGTPPVTVTGPNAPVTINYNPVTYTAPTDYLPNFTLTGGASLTQHMLVYPDGGDKPFDGNTTTTLTSLKGNPGGVTLVSDPTSIATFDTADEGTGKIITFSGYSLVGANAGSYALPISCCAPVVVQRTTGNITPVVVSPVVVSPVVVPPVVVPSVVVPPSKIIPPGTILPPGVTIPPGTIIPPGVTIPPGTILPPGVIILPGVILPPGVVLPQSDQTPPSSGTPLPLAPPLLVAPKYQPLMPKVVHAEIPDQLLTLAPVQSPPIFYIPPFHPLKKQERN
ncbi:MAG: filamentous hemagglutinin N-terminal domain-containing protein [Methylococcales bacterium]|nr:filamentous hemagglutinin N-terminal domain-containing protein [Methylococcales bacterium]